MALYIGIVSNRIIPHRIKVHIVSWPMFRGTYRIVTSSTTSSPSLCHLWCPPPSSSSPHPSPPDGDKLTALLLSSLKASKHTLQFWRHICKVHHWSRVLAKGGSMPPYASAKSFSRTIHDKHRSPWSGWVFLPVTTPHWGQAHGEGPELAHLFSEVGSVIALCLTPHLEQKVFLPTTRLWGSHV